MEIEVQDLSKRFNREWIFRGFNYTFSSGKIYAITGPNGSGKSTLLQVLWGQMPQTDGKIKYRRAGKVVPVEEIYSYISIATPYMDLIEEFTLREQLQFHFNIKKSRNNLTIQKMMEEMSLEHAHNKYISNFSSGMRQRVKLALAFFTEADIIFLDEPGTNLDNEALTWYRLHLNSLPVESLVFIASNQSSEYPDKADRIDILNFK
jgi:ABC-type multidrug transport system ATPase subunit